MGNSDVPEMPPSRIAAGRAPHWLLLAVWALGLNAAAAGGGRDLRADDRAAEPNLEAVVPPPATGTPGRAVGPLQTFEQRRRWVLETVTANPGSERFRSDPTVLGGGSLLPLRQRRRRPGPRPGRLPVLGRPGSPKKSGGPIFFGCGRRWIATSVSKIGSTRKAERRASA